MGDGSKLPYSGIGCVVNLIGTLTNLFKMFKFEVPGLRKQSIIKKRLRCTQYDMSINIMLDMFGRLIAKPYRPHATIAGEPVADFFGQIGFKRDTEYGLNMSALGHRDRISEIAEIFLECPNRRKPVECCHREVGISQPITVGEKCGKRGR